MLSYSDVQLELAVFKMVDHEIVRDTHDLVITTRSSVGFEDVLIVESSNPDYHKILGLVARVFNNQQHLQIGA